MIVNTLVRNQVVDRLERTLPPERAITVISGWQVIDANQDTPAILVYQDTGDLNEQYVSDDERYDGLLMVSVYCAGTSSDDELDVIGELVREALPQRTRFPGVCTLYRNAFQYERSESGVYRALHLTHPYQSEQS
ncbi:phage tail terminator protein [Vibrio furnissii]|uniref:phage tail terminator protein n=1 Tax=Vibrio furnissii TaxID=29494 RepID=UPI001EE9FE1C|nr:phage tail terminator protein [Vibrio furnissii]MCG6268309.1 hypothetical protein [Vibrio furnissii]